MFKSAIFGILFIIGSAVSAETRLLMAEEPGCFWCAKWNEEIGPIYPKTEAGKAAPLQRYDIQSPPQDVTLARRVVFTPTFVLVRDGQELARLEGYPGEDFFWGLLEQMLRREGVPLAPAG